MILILKSKLLIQNQNHDFDFKSPSFKWSWFKITNNFAVLILKPSHNHQKQILLNLSIPS